MNRYRDWWRTEIIAEWCYLAFLAVVLLVVFA